MNAKRYGAIARQPARRSRRATVTLDSRPEGIVLTPAAHLDQHAVLDRNTLRIEHTDGFGFTITRGSDGSIWGTGGVPGSHTGEAVVYRYAPGDLGG